MIKIELRDFLYFHGVFGYSFYYGTDRVKNGRHFYFQITDIERTREILGWSILI